MKSRSIQSWLVEKKLYFTYGRKMRKYVDEASLNELMKEKQKISDERYSIPIKIEGSSEIDVDGMQVFVWNDKKSVNQRVIFYIHGGAFIDQPVSAHFQEVDKMARRLDAKVVFPIYPKAPRYFYKDSMEKLDKLYRMILKSTSSHNNITIMGDSSGGGISLSFSMYLRDNNLPQPKDIIVFSPWVDVSMNNPKIDDYKKVDLLLSVPFLKKSGEFWAGSKENKNNPYVSSIFGSFDNLAKITIFVGTYEIFYPDNEKLHLILQENKIEHNYIVGHKMIHTYPLFPIPEAKEAQDIVVKTIKED